jgi:hypothetical protein
VKISGFTILREVVRLGYPFQESIRSLLPLVDELVVGIGEGDDGTWEAVQAIGDPRLKPFRSEWGPPGLNGLVLSRQTNLALERCTGDWAVYLQADEVLHEDDLDLLRDSMRRHLRRRTEGLLLRYLHFWKRYDLLSESYPTAVRVVKVGCGVESAGDACGFTLRSGGRTRGLLKADSGARVFHYGWCNPAEVQRERLRSLGRLFGYPDVPWNPEQEVFAPRPVHHFQGAHPRPMQARVEAAGPPGEVPPPPRGPALLRAAPAILRSTSIVWHVRGHLPIAFTNAYWTAVDLWRRAVRLVGPREEAHRPR